MLIKLDKSQFTATHFPLEFPGLRASFRVGRIGVAHEMCIHVRKETAETEYLFRVKIDGDDFVMPVPYPQWQRLDGHEADVLEECVEEIEQDEKSPGRLMRELTRAYCKRVADRFAVILLPLTPVS